MEFYISYIFFIFFSSKYVLTNVYKIKISRQVDFTEYHSSEESRPLIGCCPVQFFRIRIAHPDRLRQHYNFELFCFQIELETSYSWEHLVEVSKMNADFHVQ